jgi:tetratricopeptide (TPR) repeat protein
VPTLVIRGPDGTLVERELDDRLTVGCDDDNDLVLRSGGVEKRHANFFADGGEVVLEELGPGRGKKRLAPGVRVLIGGYEVQVKPGEQKLSVRRIEGPADTLPQPAEPSAAQFPFRLVFTVFGVALVGLVAIGVWRRLQPPPVAVVDPPPVEGCPKLEEDLRIARSGPSPQALEAAERALACDPVNGEALALKRGIPRELDGRELLKRAKEFVDLQRDEQALEQLENVPDGTDVSRDALVLLREVGARVQKRAKTDCDAYGKAGKKGLAQTRCDEAARLEKLLAPLQPAATKGPTLAERVLARVHEPTLVEPLMLYANGHEAEAVVKLQALRERNDKAVLHERADALRKDISNADGLYKVGARALEKGDLERAARAFHDALELDGKLIPEGESALKHNVEREMSQKGFALGTVQAQHGNWSRACAAWKLGFSFFRGDTELNAALTQDCTNRAKQLADSADCKVLAEALALAVPGDGFEEQVSARRAALHCP